MQSHQAQGDTARPSGQDLWLSGALCVALALAGCKNTTRPSYELVMELRPDSVEHYFKPMRDVYDECVLEAKKQGLSVKPFMTLPAQHVVSRTTNISDGQSFYKKAVGWNIDRGGIRPHTGCGTQLIEHTDVTIVHSGVQWGFYHDRRGPEIGPVDILPPNLEKFAQFSVSRNINGVALQCAGPTAEANMQESNWCVVDPAIAFVTYPEGSPLIAHQRMDFFKPDAVLAEVPVSLKVGINIDPALFDAKAFTAVRR